MKKIIVANIYREKNKQSFFALHQIYKKIKDFDSSIEIEFHIIWDKIENENSEINKYWVNLINTFGFNIISYDKKFFVDYVVNTYGQDRITIQKNFDNFFAIYVLLLFHYLRRCKLYEHCLRYDDDILINYDFADIINFCLENRSILINEPFNQNCDKIMLEKLINLYGGESAFEFYKLRNPNFLGFNAGFQGIDLSIYDDFLSPDRFETFLNLFNYESIYDSEGKEIWGQKRFIIDTQEQSFAGVTNILKSRKEPIILDPKQYYVAPNWGTHPEFGEINTSDENNGWTVSLKSKITHFIGHTQGKGKPKQFLDRVENYLFENNFIN